MIAKKLLLDGAEFNKKFGSAKTQNQIETGKWLIKYNQYRILVEREGCSKTKYYDVTIYDNISGMYKHCTVWKHVVDRYKQRSDKECRKNYWYWIIKDLLSDSPIVSNVTNVIYHGSVGDKYKTFAYDITDEGTLIYKTFFLRPKKLCK